MRICKPLVVLVLAVALVSCMGTTKPKSEVDFQIERLEFAESQLSGLLAKAEQVSRIPRTIDLNNEIHWTNEEFDWTEGFFPGSCWYLYEYTKDEKWKKAAEYFQALFETHKYKTTNHDLGFIFNCSYGNGYRLTHTDAFKEVMITAADSLLVRFNPNVGCIKSWDVDRGWQAKRGWKYPVIIDNMMNLELLFKASEYTAKDVYRNAAIAHANTTLKNHFRNDNSSVHVVDYDPDTGVVRSKQTAQGFADSSSWARGQAWGLYGYTVCYRYTEDEKYLEQAKKIANYILSYQGTPKDKIPYWDYDAPNVPNEPRDVSAAAITVSALLELDTYVKDVSYLPEIKTILDSLSSEAYTPKLNDNHNFLLKHSVGSIPHKNEIDVPLNYADYYYIEALNRYMQLLVKSEG